MEKFRLAIDPGSVIVFWNRDQITIRISGLRDGAGPGDVAGEDEEGATDDVLTGADAAAITEVGKILEGNIQGRM